MDSITQNLGSVNWWVGVVIVGILINLISAYLKKPADKFLSGFSNWWSTRTEKQRREREIRIQKMRVSPSEQILASLEMLHLRVRVNYWVLLFLFCVVIVVFEDLAHRTGWTHMAIKIFGLFPAIGALNDYKDVIRSKMEILEARRNQPPETSN
jgi:hypothetical protein